MSLQVDDLNIVQNNPKPQMNATFRPPFAVATNKLERTPSADTLLKPTENENKKTLLTLGVVLLAGIGLLKLGKAHYQKKAIQEIEKKFLELQNDMPRVLKTFKEVFLRKDISCSQL